MKIRLKVSFIISIIISFFPFISNIYSQTNVSGFISTNTTWNVLGSPYIVTGNIYVLHGNTLTIDPGTVIKFNPDKALQIDGEMIAIGTPQNKILFTSNQTIPASGDWAKIQFSDTCVSAVFDVNGNYLSGSIMKYCDIEYGGSLGFGMVHIITSSPYFTHCKISNSSADGIYSYETVYSIDSSTVEYCSGIGLSFDRHWKNHCGILIQDNFIKNNLSGGVFFKGHHSFTNCNYNHLTQIKRNYFYSNSPFGFIIEEEQYDSVIITGNTFEKNFGNGVTLGINVTTYLIECNKFGDNHTNNGILSIGGGHNWFATTSSFNVNRNIFTRNSVSNNSASIISINNGANNKDISLVNNVIEYNFSTSGPICFLEGSITSVYQLHYNKIVNNTGKSAVRIFQYFITGSNYTYLSMSNNNISNPGCQYEFYNDVPYGGPNLHVDSNYWGSSSIQYVDSVIYDYFDFANQSAVLYNPLLSTPVNVDSSCAGSNTGFYELFNSSNDISLFPNPASNRITIEFKINESYKNYMLEIFNIYGEKYFEENVGQNIIKEIDLTNYSPGIYFLRISNGKTYVCKKFVVNK